MTQKPQRQLGPVLVPRVEPEIQWRDYDRIEPGIYPAYCRWAKHYRDPGFKRWTCLLRFDVLSDDLMRVLARVPLWMNLGARDKPHAGRRKRYFKEWVRANGEPPVRRDRLSPKVFTGRMVRIEIGDTKGDAPYSVVRKIVSWETGSGFGVTQSASHTVKDGKDYAMEKEGFVGDEWQETFGPCRGRGLSLTAHPQRGGGSGFPAHPSTARQGWQTFSVGPARQESAVTVTAEWLARY